MTQKIVKVSIDPLGIFSDFIGEDVKIELPVPDYLVPLFKFQGEEVEGDGVGEWEGRSEEGKVLNLLEAADRELKRGNIEGAYAHLDYAVKLSSCGRCVRNMKSIKQKIKDGDLPEARRRLKTLIDIIPTYYQIIETEGEIGTELNATKNIEESCDTCAASEILEICNWDTRCLDRVIAFIETQKAKGLKVMSDELITKAKEYRGDKKK